VRVVAQRLATALFGLCTQLRLARGCRLNRTLSLPET
jgi:hypothetical protein